MFSGHVSRIAQAVARNECTLVDKCNSCGAVSPASVAFNNVMGPHGYRMRFIAGERNKAGSFDRVNADIALSGPEKSARLYHPLHVIMAIAASEPLELKGSHAHVLKKKGKVVPNATASRYIMLRYLVIKHPRAFVRSMLYAIVHASIHVPQTGGIKRRGAELPNALNRWTQHAFKMQGKSGVTLYTDLEAAF